MTRRTALAAGIAARLAAQTVAKTALVAPPGYSVMDMGGLKHLMPDQPEQIAMLIYPGMTALDLIGPQQAFGYTQGCKVDLVWKTADPIVTDTGVRITPSKTLKELAGPVDLLFVPGGGRGTVALMTDSAVLDFLAEKGRTARYVTSVCSGSLVLGAAGLLRGYRATSHWAVRDVLPALGAQRAAGRIVEDGNRITAGGVTAGIDFGLYLVAKLRGEDYARAVQLMLEYDPHPPFDSGTPAQAHADTRDFVTHLYAPLVQSATASADAARRKWGVDGMMACTKGLGPVLAALMLLSAACWTPAQTKSEKPRKYPLRGVVVRLDPKSNLASINAEKIEGWMAAMTMEYPVENKSEYLALYKGERITATVNVTSEGFWLTGVKERKD